MAQNLKPSEISEVLLEQLRQISTGLRLEEIGKVLQVSDGVVRIYGLRNAEAGELLEFESGELAVVMNLEEDNVGAILLGPTDEIKEGMTVHRTGRIASIGSARACSAGSWTRSAIRSTASAQSRAISARCRSSARLRASSSASP